MAVLENDFVDVENGAASSTPNGAEAMLTLGVQGWRASSRDAASRRLHIADFHD
jgi:hypothetical protein